MLEGQITSNFYLCLAETLKWEGGYSNHPQDPGGPTQWGVIQVRYDQYRDDVGLPRRTVKQITRTEAEDIYKRYYWNAVKGDSLPAGVDLIVFDYGVNSGPSRAIKHLQEVLGVDQDGVLGPATLKAVSSISPDKLINLYQDRRLKFVKGLSTFKTFGKGWTRRIAGIRTKALSMSVTPTIPQTQQSPTASQSLIEWLISCLVRLFSKS